MSRYRPLLCGLLVAGALSFPATRAEAIYGAVTTNRCSSGIADVEGVARWSRVASRSQAFASCLDTALRTGGVGPGNLWGPYRKCWKTHDGVREQGYRDPYYDSDIDTQIARALDAARSTNDIQIDCPSACAVDLDCSPQSCVSNADCDPSQPCVAGRCSTGQTCLASKMCTAGTSSGGKPETAYSSTAPEELSMQVAPFQWTWDVVAGNIAHEAMHQHGYVHGDTDGLPGTINDDAGACGLDPKDPTFVSANNTIPYLVGNCIQYVLAQSKNACGSDFDTSCPNGGMKLLNNVSGSQCACVDDQRDPYQKSGYVCQVGQAPKPADPAGGNAGYLYVSINDAPRCGGNPVEDGYVYSTGATYTGSHWSPASLYSEPALNALSRSLQKAVKTGKSVRLSGTKERPHSQVQSITVFGN